MPKLDKVLNKREFAVAASVFDLQGAQAEALLSKFLDKNQTKTIADLLKGKKKLPKDITVSFSLFDSMAKNT